MHITDYVFLKNIVPFTEQTIVQMHELITLARDPSTGVEVKDRTYHLRTYKQCFVAKEFVTWLCTRLNVERHIAVRVALFLQQRGYLIHVVADHLIKDDYLFFRFTNFRPLSRKKSLSDTPVLVNKNFYSIKESIKKRFTVARPKTAGRKTLNARTPKLDLPLYLASKQETVIKTPETFNLDFDLSSPSSKQTRSRARSEFALESPILLSEVLSEESEQSGPPDQEYDSPSDKREFEIKISSVRINGLKALPSKCIGGREGKDIVTKGMNKPYCKLVIEDDVITTDHVECLDPKFFMDATFRVTRFPAHLTVAVLDEDKAPMTDGNDLFGYFDVLIDEVGSFDPEEIELQTSSGRDNYIGATAQINFSCKLVNK
jgi:hypothetical protein